MANPPILSQEDFNQYIRNLPPKEKCQFMIEGPVNLCRTYHSCPYKGRESYRYRDGERRECKREDILKQKQLLGEKE